jgi:hypothetical protein
MSIDLISADAEAARIRSTASETVSVFIFSSVCVLKEQIAKVDREFSKVVSRYL